MLEEFFASVFIMFGPVELYHNVICFVEVVALELLFGVYLLDNFLLVVV